MELIGKLESNDTSNIRMLTSASKDVSIEFVEKFLHILNNKDRVNLLKGSTKMQHRESLFKYQSRLNNVQRNDDVNHIGIKLRWNNKIFPLLNVINRKSAPYVIKGVLRHYNYM